MARSILGFSDGEAAARHAAIAFTRLAKKAIWDRGVFHVALAGGRTPRRTYELLATAEFRRRVEWSSVQIYFGDERAVEPDHPDSNFNSANEALLSSLTLHSSQVHRMAGERGDLNMAAREYEQELARFFGVKHRETLPRFDLVMLGMGKDGHTASLFPFTAALEENDAWVVRNEVPQMSTERLTLTAPVINAARNVIFLVEGRDKGEALERVLEGPRNPREFPAQLIAPLDGDVWWLVDEAAGAYLKRPPETPGMEQEDAGS
jgi:6-phosphogluconolactonase